MVSNPATGKISHTKLWANVAAAAMTWKFVQAADALFPMAGRLGL
ncbi:TPA: hypothetical protein ACJMFI_001915 [Neisseria meningitidis]